MFKRNLGDLTSFIGVTFAEAVLPTPVSDIVIVALEGLCLVCAVSAACSVFPTVAICTGAGRRLLRIARVNVTFF